MGLDVGTTSTQLIVSRLEVRNRASDFAVPEWAIVSRRIVYQSPVHFTPLLDESHVDGEGLRALLFEEYAKAGITREQVDTGAVIVTGETSRKENAREVTRALSDFAGDFVVATAGPDLESALAARGSGAVAYSEKTGKTLLHMDIGGGTANLALIESGEIVATGCLNVGGRLVKFREDGGIRYVSPVLKELWDGKDVEALCAELSKVLEAAAGLGEHPWLEALTTPGTRRLPLNRGEVIPSFSGGVADCIRRDYPPRVFGDIGPSLGKRIREGRLCSGEYYLGEQTIRATVIGAGCHSAMLSGSTVFCRNVGLPLKNLRTARLEDRPWEGEQDMPWVLAIPGEAPPDYGSLSRLAQTLAEKLGNREIRLCLEGDYAQALGQRLALLLGKDAKILCIDRVRLPEGSYLDVGQPLGPAFPVVVKTLIFSG